MPQITNLNGLPVTNPASTLPGTTPAPTTAATSTGRNKPGRKKETTQDTTQSGTSSGTETFNTSGTQANNPYAPAKSYLDGLLPMLQQAFNGTDRTGYTGDFFAGATPQHQNAIDQLFGASGQIGQGADAIQGYADKLSSGYYLDPSTNTQLQGMVDAAIRPVDEKFRYSLMPGLEDAAIAGGAYGGARQDLLKQTLGEGYAREMVDASSKIFYDNYTRERQNQNLAPDFYNAADSMRVAGPSLGVAAGEIQQNQDQINLNNDQQKYMEEQSAPWRGMDQFANILQGLYGGYGSSSTTSSGTGTNTGTSTGTSNTVGTAPGNGGFPGAAQGAMGGALSGAKLGAMTGHPIIGAILGGLFGGAGGFFG